MKTHSSPIEPLEQRIAPATFTVTNGNNSGAGSLRQAILDANGDTTLDNIQFNLPFPYTIALTTALPTILHPVYMDGYTQPQAKENTDPVGYNGLVYVQLTGFDAPEGSSGLVISSGGTTIRGISIIGFQASAVTGGGHGILLENVAANNGNDIQGCFIGISGFGLASGNEGSGVRVLAGSNNNVIGGSSPADRNLIGGNLGPGVELASDNNFVRGNFIGSAGAANGGGGVVIAGFAGNVIGGLNPGEGNIISSNTGAGVRLSSGNGNPILGNSIFGNTGLGIDLGNVGVTPNDATDSDSGGNTLLNFPNITSAFTGTAATRVSVDYVTNPSLSLRIEFFASTSSDGTAFGEGQRYLGSVNATSDAAGVVNFTTILNVVETPGHFITATATANNNTSEFSQARSMFSAASLLNVASNGKNATYLDADGDMVTVKTTKGTLAFNLFDFDPTGFTSEGAQLANLNLTDTAFAGATISIIAKRAATGDGFASVGRINATNVNLGKVIVDGNLAEIDAGHGDPGKFGLLGLTVHSLGIFSAAVPVSSINGNVGSLRVLSDIAGASISVTGTIGSVFAGGSLLGDGTASSGKISASGRIGAVTILGDFRGSGQFVDATLQSGATIGAIKIGGDFAGAQILAVGDLTALTAAKALTVKSVTVGGSVSDSQILAGYNGAVGVNARSQIGLVKVKLNWVNSDLVAGAVRGSDGVFGTADDAAISAGAPVASRIASIVIGGQAYGTFGGTDGYGFVAQQIGALRVGGTVFKLAKTTSDDVLVGPTNDLRLHEVL